MLVKLDRKIKLKKVFDDKNLGLKKANKLIKHSKWDDECWIEPNLIVSLTHCIDSLFLW